MCDINFQFYDLHIGNVGEHVRSTDGCPRESSVPPPADTDRDELGVAPIVAPSNSAANENRTCVGDLVGGKPLCYCKPGRTGDDCDTSKFCT